MVGDSARLDGHHVYGGIWRHCWHPYRAQFSGKRDLEGVQNVLRFKLWLVGVLSVAGLVVLHFFDEPLWEYWPQVKITNNKWLSAIPSGYAVKGDYYQFSGFMQYAAFWTADSDPADATKALYRYINVNQPEVYTASADKATFAASVRCVK